MFGRQESFFPVIKSTYEEICIRVKYLLEQVSLTDYVGLGDVLESYLSLQGHVFRKLPLVAVDNANVDFEFIFKLGIILLVI